MARQYWTLVEWQGKKWAPQFGDYDREVVVQERRDWIDAGAARPKHLLIIRSLDDKASVDAAVERLNERDAG